MSTDIHARRALSLAFVTSALLFGASTVFVKAESGEQPDVQYANLPPADHMGAPAITGSLPNMGKQNLRSLSSFYAHVDQGSIILRASTPTKCLPDKLREVVADVSAKFGTVSIESTHRTSGRNWRAGGARHSLHLSCRAVDFRVRTRGRDVMAYLRSRPEVGGLKIYRNGIIHIDNGERRTW